MNRKERRAQGLKGKEKDTRPITNEAISLARSLRKHGKHDEAKALYMKILKVDPENEIAMIDLGVGAVNGGYLEEAEEFLTQVLRLNPKNGPALTVLAVVKMEQSKRDEALRLMEKALKLNPSPPMLNRIGVLYLDAGRLDLAEKYLLLAIEKKPDYIEAYYHLKSVKKLNAEQVAQLKEIDRTTRLTLDNKIHLEFTLGNACMDLGRPEEAFQHLAEGNMLQRATDNYNVAGFEKYVDSAIALFNKDVVDRLRGKANTHGLRPIFIVGLPRSGSTLADQILSSHSNVGSVGESRYLAASTPVFVNEEVPNHFNPNAPTITRKFLEHLTPETLNGIAQKYQSLIAPHAEKTNYVVDKMLFNFGWVGLMRLAFPDCKIVHCVRDPVDTGLSIWRLLFTDDIPWVYDMKEIARFTLAYKKLMKHWHELLPGEIYDLNYEAVVENQELETRKLLEFCGLPWEDACLNFHETERRVATASSAQVRKPIYKDSVKKWKKYEQYLKPMIEALGITE